MTATWIAFNQPEMVGQRFGSPARRTVALALFPTEGGLYLAAGAGYGIGASTYRD